MASPAMLKKSLVSSSAQDSQESSSGSPQTGQQDKHIVQYTASSYAAGEFPANIPRVAETQADITENSGPETVGIYGELLSPEDMIVRQLAHQDENIHDLQQAIARLEKMVTEIHAEMEAARPLVEKWQHSKIRRLAAGEFPWSQT